jgi:hypothetical protein
VFGWGPDTNCEVDLAGGPTSRKPRDVGHRPHRSTFAPADRASAGPPLRFLQKWELIVIVPTFTQNVKVCQPPRPVSCMLLVAFVAPTFRKVRERWGTPYLFGSTKSSCFVQVADIRWQECVFTISQTW